MMQLQSMDKKQMTPGSRYIHQQLVETAAEWKSVSDKEGHLKALLRENFYRQAFGSLASGLPADKDKSFTDNFVVVSGYVDKPDTEFEKRFHITEDSERARIKTFVEEVRGIESLADRQVEVGTTRSK